MGSPGKAENDGKKVGGDISSSMTSDEVDLKKKLGNSPSKEDINTKDSS
jgi:hypothetical protein